jgi:MoxR-like ATPase
MAIDFKTFIAIAPHVTAVRKPVLLRGRHGVGKSEVVYQTAESLELPVVERRASQMTEGDLLGLPSTNGNVTSWNPPNWFKLACDEPVVLFLDEIDRATTEVRQGIFELTDSRKLNGHRLHPDTLIFAAVNGGEHGDQYQVGEMDPAELDRWTVFDVEPSVEDWLIWAKDRVDGVVWDFINQNHNHLEHSDEFEPNKVYPSRRSWQRLNECLSNANLLERGASPVLFNLSAAFVGFEAAVSFNDFVANYDRQVTIEDILDDGRLDAVKDWDINEHSALVEKMEAKDIFKDELSEARMDNLANYFVLLPSEVAMKLWTVMGSGEIANTVALHQATTVDGISISSHMVELLTGNSTAS